MQKMEDNDYLRLFAQRVRALREEQGISQEKLAERAELHRTYIGMVERLERNPSLICIHKIANGLGVHVAELNNENRNLLRCILFYITLNPKHYELRNHLLA